MGDNQEESSPKTDVSNDTKTQDSNKEPVETRDKDTQPSCDPLPGEVTCDSCIENLRKASKSCLICMVSYCEEHLRPHLENTKFQNHRLVEPQLDLELRLCKRHHLDVQLFCAEDNCCICPSCEAEDHQGHSITTIGEARQHVEDELQHKQKEMVKTLSTAEQAISKLQGNAESIDNSVAGVQAVIEEQFSILQSAVENAQKRVLDVLEGEHKQALGQADSIMTHLEQRISELKKTMGQVEKLSRNKNDVDFLQGKTRLTKHCLTFTQEYTEWKKGLVDVCLPGVYISLIDRLNTFSSIIKDTTEELCNLLLHNYNEQLNKHCKSEELCIKTMVQPSTPTKRLLSAPEPVTRDDFLKYAANLSFNPDSAHKFLRLTEDNRKASNTTPWQHNYPDTPERFEHWRQVTTSESLYLGRHYFEVELAGEGAYVGLTYKSMDRKGQENSSCIIGNDISWCFGRESNGYSAWHADVETSLEVEEFDKIGSYVDYDKGLLVFYGVGESMILLHKYSANFLEPLYPVFWLSKKDNSAVLVKPRDH